MNISNQNNNLPHFEVYINEDKTYYMKEVNGPESIESAIDTLMVIEKIVTENLTYSPKHRDNFSKMMESDRLELLKINSGLINQKYAEIAKNSSWIYKMVFSRENYVNSMCEKIDAGVTEKTKVPENTLKELPVRDDIINQLKTMINVSYKYFKLLEEIYPDGNLPGFLLVPAEEEYIEDLKLLEGGENLQGDKIRELREKHSNLLSEVFSYLLGTGTKLSVAEQFSLYPDQIWLLLQKSQEEGHLVKTPQNGCHALHYAAIIGDLNGITEAVKLIKDTSKDEINATSKKGETPLSVAIRFDRGEAVELLIRLGADITKKVIDYPLLHHAVRSGNLRMVKLLTAQPNLNLLAVDGCQRTALHVALCSESPNKEIIDYLSSLPDLKRVVSSARDIFGLTIMDLEGKHPIDVNQDKVVSKLTQYLKMKDRSTAMLPPGGQCNGLAFLAQYYTAIGKHDAFYKVMELFAEWDETEGSLKDPEVLKELADVYGLEGYNDLEDLMEQWINDIVWFMHKHHLYGSGYSTLGEGGQSLRVEQFETVKAEKAGLSVLMIEEPKSSDYTKDRLIEKIQEYQQKPSTILEFGRGGHKTSAQVLEGGKFFYYDPILPYKVKFFDSVEELAQVIIDTKYKALGKQTDPTFDLSFMAYRFQSI